MARKRITQLSPASGVLEDQFLAVDREGSASAEKISMAQVKEYVSMQSRASFYDVSSKRFTLANMLWWEPINMDVTVKNVSSDFSISNLGIVTYNGNELRKVHVGMSVYLADSNNKEIYVSIYKNDIGQAESRTFNTIHHGLIGFYTHAVVDIENGDQINFRAMCSTNQLAMTLQSISVIIKEF